MPEITSVDARGHVRHAPAEAARARARVENLSVGGYFRTDRAHGVATPSSLGNAGGAP